jgi:uncharacterized membrane protein YdjX (TVP38/TMEM64 family)
VSRALRLAGRIAALAALVAGAAFAWAARGTLDPASIAAMIAAQPAAPVVFLALHVAASLLFLPRTVLAVAAGLVFGMAWGLVWRATSMPA